MTGPKGYILVSPLQKPHWLGGGDNGSVRLSPVHLHPTCQHMKRPNSHANVVVVDLARLADDPILSQLSICGKCTGEQWVRRPRRQRTISIAKEGETS